MLSYLMLSYFAKRARVSLLNEDVYVMGQLRSDSCNQIFQIINVNFQFQTFPVMVL